MIFATNVPEVMKLATIDPSDVIAVSYGPLYPLDENPSPPIFHLQTFIASSIFSLSRISSSYGVPSFCVCKTTQPPFAPVISLVALAIALVNKRGNLSTCFCVASISS